MYSQNQIIRKTIQYFSLSDVDDDYEDEEDEGEASFVDKSLGMFSLIFACDNNLYKLNILYIVQGMQNIRPY